MPRPDDECPYPKPFAADFDACPAFQARQFIPLDTLYQPLDPVLTCRHLETRSLPQRHRWYAACGLGDAEQRRRWAREVGVSRLQRIRAVQRQLSVAIAPYNARLWELKGQQLRAIHDGRDASQATAELRRLAGQMTADLDAFLKEKSATFTDIDMPIEAARVLIQVAIDRFIDTQFATEVSFEVPDDVLQRFPEPVRTFFRPSVPQRPAGPG
ncbi:MAG: hypothetical protein E6I84_02455 [Chloroflexi bacterium]|nr:MAG: hypothetical protein E6I84_02455 [Chloroflexota bacterium]